MLSAAEELHCRYLVNSVMLRTCSLFVYFITMQSLYFTVIKSQFKLYEQYLVHRQRYLIQIESVILFYSISDLFE